MACSLTDPGACIGAGVNAIVGDAIENMANAVLEAYGKAVASLGTMWVNIGTPNLTGSGSSSSITAGSAAPNAGGINTVLNYVTWIGLAIAILSLIILGALVATRMRAGEGIAAVGRVGLVLAAVVFISGAGSLVAALLPDGPRGASGTVGFLQSSLWWYMGAAAVASVIIGGVRMVWEQRAEPGKEVVKSLITLVVVAGAGVTVVGLLVAAADSFAVWILNGSLECDVTGDSACFGENILGLLALTTAASTVSSIGSLLVIILGLIAVLAAVFQIVLMVARGGMLVILTGTLPLSASFTSTEMGKQWFRKNVSWLVAFILYKPVAAIVYAAAFQLVGTDVFADDGTGLLSVLTGLMLMVIALFAMPALMRFVTPMVGAMAGGAGGGALGAGAAMALPSGAASLGRLGTGSGSGSSSSSSPGPQGSTGSAGPQGPSGDSGAASGSTSAGGAAQTSQPAAASAGSAASAAGSAGGAAAGGAAAGGATAAGAAAGPVGIAAGAAVDAGMKVGKAAAGAAKSVGQESTGEGGGPDGSR